jgi:hypothetical protein
VPTGLEPVNNNFADEVVHCNLLILLGWITQKMPVLGVETHPLPTQMQQFAGTFSLFD